MRERKGAGIRLLASFISHHLTDQISPHGKVISTHTFQVQDLSNQWLLGKPDHHAMHTVPGTGIGRRSQDPASGLKDAIFSHMDSGSVVKSGV